MSLADAAPFAVAAWPLDEVSGTRVDQVGSNDLTDNSTVGSAAGIFGNAADFEMDNSEYLSVSDNADVSTGDISFMMRCWVKWEGGGAFPIIVSKGGSGSAREYVLYLNATTPRFEVRGPTTTSEVIWSSSLSNGVWYLIHIWHNHSTNEIGITVNAGTAVTQGHAEGLQDTAAEFQLGASVSQSLYWDGLIDDFVFLKGYILDATERTEDYNSGAGVAFADWDVVEAGCRGTLLTGGNLAYSNTGLLSGGAL